MRCAPIRSTINLRWGVEKNGLPRITSPCTLSAVACPSTRSIGSVSAPSISKYLSLTRRLCAAAASALRNGMPAPFGLMIATDARPGTSSLRMFSANPFDAIFDRHRSRVLEDKRAFDMFALRQLVLEADKHNVRASGLELNALPRLDFD